ncbi:MAG: mechanosensitive ion channel family protein [Eubacterium sp.]|nr:mechanosensitive ion channel family protein [Eubacterium sp.]
MSEASKKPIKSVNDKKPDMPEKSAEKTEMPPAENGGQTAPSFNIHRKTRLCVGIIILALVLSLFVLILEAIDLNIRRSASEIEEMIGEYFSYTHFQGEMAVTLSDFDEQNFQKDALLEASVLRKTTGENDEDPLDVQLYKDGCVFRYKGGKAEFPKGMPDDMDPGSIVINKDSGVTYTNEDLENGDDSGKKCYIVAYSKIRGDLYYMEWIILDELAERSLTTKVEWDSLSENLARTYGIDFIIGMKGEDGKSVAAFDATGDFVKYKNGEKLDLSWDRVIESLDELFTIVILDGKVYMLEAMDMDDVAKQQGFEWYTDEDESEVTDVVIALLPFASLLKSSTGLIMTFQFIMLMLCIALVVWTISTYRMIVAGGLNDKDINEQSPASIRSKMIAFAVISTIIVGVGCAYSHSLNDLFRESNESYNALEHIVDSVEISRKGNDAIWTVCRDQYVRDAEKIAAELDENPELRTREWLQEAADLIDADYIMIFDEDGNETLTNSRYRNISLGKDESSATYDFRRLLSGVKSITHEKVKDEITGLTRDMCGVSVKFAGEDKDAYGALIIAVDPERRSFTDILDINVILERHTLGRYVSFAADPEKDKIRYSSEEELRGEDLPELGFDEENLKAAFIGFFDLGTRHLFGRSMGNNSLLYYYAADESKMFYGIVEYSLICMVMFLVTIILIIWVLLRGFNDKVYDYYLGLDEPETAGDAGDGRKPFIKKVARAVGMQGTPLHKTMVTMLMLAVVCIAFLAIRAVLAEHGSEEASSSVVRYVMTGGWEKGFNVFSATAAFFIACVVVVIETALYLLRTTLRNVLDSRGMTISALVTSVLQYLVLAIGLFVVLGYFGVDYKAMLASVGILSMAVSFGAKDFVADIFAGANLLIDNTYQMGDIVDINGYTGTVQEVSLRTTKIIGSGGNIKTIRNSDISNVLNMSAMDSWYPMEVVVSSSQDINEIEKVLKENLPKIREKHPEIISGPEYRGIEAIGGGKVTILVLTSCSQVNYYKVQRIINKEILALFTEKEITIL